MKIAERIILEAKQVGDLYHFTEASSILSILRNNNLLRGDNGYISFTRDKDFYKRIKLRNPSHIRILVDGDALSNKFKLEPHGGDKESKEAEERIDKRAIKPIKKYIKRIDVLDKEFMKQVRSDIQYLDNETNLGMDMDSKEFAEWLESEFDIDTKVI